MASELSLFPTHSEAQTIASFATTSSAEPFGGIQYFHALLKVLRDPAISKFLFASEPIELQHLVHPQLPQFSLTNDMYETNVELDTNPNNSLSDYWNSRHFTFPVYSSDDKTFGFLVSKDKYIPGSAWGLHVEVLENLSVSRFVHHNEEGYTVFVARYEQYNAWRLEYTKMITNTRQVRFLVAVDDTKFQELRQRESLFVKNMFPALLVMQMSTEYRRCPTCYLSANECFCAPSIVKPRHPFDYEAFRKSLMNTAGVFEGRTIMSLFGGGVKLRSGVLGSRFVSNPKPDIDFVEGLRRLTITKYAGGETARHSNIFADAVNNLRKLEIGNQADSSVETALEDSHSNGLGVASQAINLASSPYELDYALPVNGFAQHVEASHIDPIPSLVDIILAEPELSLDPLIFGASSNVPENEVAGTQSVDEVLRSDAFDSQKSTICQTTEGQTSSESESNGTDLVSAAKTSEEKTKADDQIRRLKAELRKERNRACAQRSNMKKKAMMDALKNDIKSTRERVDLLRSQELLLRRQNIFLREQVAERRVAEKNA